MTRVVQASGGRVTPEMFFSTFKYGRTATLGWDEQFIGGALPRLIEEYAAGGGGGGSGNGGPGNALMSAFAKVVQGQMPKKAAEEWQRMGLTPGGISPIEGSSETMINGGISSSVLFQKNPYEWTQKVLMPALAAHGITDQNAIIQEISQLFPVRTASDVIAKMGLQGRFHEGANSPFEKDIRLNQGAMGLPAFDDLIKNDYPMILEAFHTQWKNLLETLGSPLMAPGGPVIQAMAGVTQAMGSLAAVAGRNTEGIKSIMNVAGDIGHVVYVVDGALLKLVGAFSGLGNVFSSLGAIPWERIRIQVSRGWAPPSPALSTRSKRCTIACYRCCPRCPVSTHLVSKAVPARIPAGMAGRGIRPASIPAPEPSSRTSSSPSR